MKIGMVGLGKMGANMTKRLIEKGHEVVGFDLGAEARATVAGYGAETAATLEELAGKLSAPRVAWVMVPSGKPTDETVAALGSLFDPGDIVIAAFKGPRAIWTMVPSGKVTEDLIAELAGKMSKGDVIIDGGNSNFHDSKRRAEECAKKGIGFLDAGTSGGIWGLKLGYCLMVGGSPEAVSVAEPIFLALAPEGGYAHVGPVGAGHFVKMVHNGIEYGLMEAYAEGFELMSKAEEYNLDLHEIASIWRYGSVVRSWLLELTELALRPGAGFENIEPYVVDSGEGRWTLEEALDRDVPVPVIAASLFRRYERREKSSYGLRLLAALRNQFGGHAVVRADQKGS